MLLRKLNPDSQEGVAGKLPHPAELGIGQEISLYQRTGPTNLVDQDNAGRSMTVRFSSSPKGGGVTGAEEQVGHVAAGDRFNDATGFRPLFGLAETLQSVRG